MLIDVTSRAPGAIAATISLDVRPASAATDLATPAADVRFLGHVGVRPVDEYEAAPVDSLERLRRIRPIRGENHHIAFRGVLLGSCAGGRTQIGYEPHQSLWPPRTGQDDLVARTDHVTTDGRSHATRADEPDFHDRFSPIEQ